MMTAEELATWATLQAEVEEHAARGTHTPSS
jgi:hypothetical protein